MSDQDFILSLRDGNEASARKLYAHFRSDVLRYLHSRTQLTDDECKDVYADAIVALCRNARKTEFMLTAALKTYIISICKHKALNVLRQRCQTAQSTNLDALGAAVEMVDEETAEENLFDVLTHVLKGLGESCRHLLEAFYVKQMSYEQIVKESAAYSSAESARAQKSKCISRARDYVKKLSDAGRAFF